MDTVLDNTGGPRLSPGGFGTVFGAAFADPVAKTVCCCQGSLQRNMNVSHFSPSGQRKGGPSERERLGRRPEAGGQRETQQQQQQTTEHFQFLDLSCKQLVPSAHQSGAPAYAVSAWKQHHLIRELSLRLLPPIQRTTQAGTPLDGPQSLAPCHKRMAAALAHSPSSHLASGCTFIN